MEITAGEPHPAPLSDGDGHILAAPWGPRDVGIGILLFILVFFVASFAFAIPVFFFEQESDAYYLVGSIGTMPVYIAIAVLAYQLTAGKYGGGFERLGIRRPQISTFGWAGAALVAAFLFGATYGYVVSMPGLEFMTPECDDQIPLQVRNNALLLAVSSFGAVMFAPVAEELFFRGFAFRGLLRWGVLPAAIVSALLFSSAHLINPQLYTSVIPITAIGAIFALAFYRSGNLLTSIMAHFAFNLIVTITIAATECHPS